jgi:hypothetical protein
MKTCRKCKNEYKDDYMYCPKCGTPYDAKKKAMKIPDSILSDSASDTIKKIWNIILYIFGGLLILAYIGSFKINPVNSIFAILFGLSLFQIFYKLISNKANSDSVDKALKIIRIVLPIVILIIWMIVTPVDSKQNDDNKQSKSSTSTQETSETTSEVKDDTTSTTQTTQSTTQTTTETPKEVVYELKYKLLGDYGKLVEYEGTNEYFYYFPSGTYTIELTRQAANLCFLWIDYNEGYKSDYGTSYNNKEKLTFTQKGEKQEATLTDDTHIYNSNDCNYKLTKKN